MRKICLVFLILLTACKALPDTKSVSILEMSSCKLPCWNDIIAGQTTQDELLKILENSAVVDQRSIQNVNQPWNIFDNQILFSFERSWILNQQPKIRSYAYITDNKVSELTICGELGISMGDIVSEIGEPESIISGDNVSGDRTVILISSQKGIQYRYSTNPGLNELQYEISQSTEIDCFTLFDPNLYEKMLEAKRFSNGYYNAEETLRVMYPWNGYGNLDEKYPPRQP